MDALKFAFEVLVVGALALPWLAILVRMFVDDSVVEEPKGHDPHRPFRRLPKDDPFHLSVVPESVRDAVVAVFVIAVGYMLGSAVSRISRDFFNDELLRKIPTEDQIREAVYKQEYCREDVLNAEELPVKGHKRLPASLCSDEADKADKTLGSISDRGLFKAPDSIGSTLAVTVKASNSNASGTATIVLTSPSKVTVSLDKSKDREHRDAKAPLNSTPCEMQHNATAKSSADAPIVLTPGETRQFLANVEGSPCAPVSWALSPPPAKSVSSPADGAWERLKKKVVNWAQNVFAVDRQDDLHERVQEMFLIQESNLLLNGLDKVDRLKQYFDQITVLRGAAFNGFVLFFVCLFGYLVPVKQSWQWRVVSMFAAFCVALVLFGYGLVSLLIHVRDSTIRYNDPPLAEFVLVLLGMCGFLVMIKKAKGGIPYGRTCVMALVLTIICFGGWWWTEVMYNLQVIHSIPELLEKNKISEAEK